MVYPFRVELTVGPYSWTVHNGDAPVLPVLLDGLKVGWRFPDSVLWPVQPEPVTCSYSILAASAADLASINIGTLFHLKVYAGAVDSAGVETPTVRTAGRVAQLDAYPFVYPAPGTGAPTQGWRLDVQCVDYTADAAQITVFASGAYGNEAILAWQRINQLVSPSLGGAVNVGSPTDPRQGDGSNDTNPDPAYDTSYATDLDGAGGNGGTTVGFGPYLVTGANLGDIYGPTSLADTFESLLSVWPEAGYYGAADPSVPSNHPKWAEQGFRRGIYRAKLNSDGTLNAATPWRIEWVSRRNVASATSCNLPLKFAAHSGTYGPIPGAASGNKDTSILVDASRIEYDARWTRTKSTEPNRVVVSNGVPDKAQVTWNKVTRSAAGQGQAVVTATVDGVPIRDSFWAGFLADLYNGDDENDGATQWTVGELTWLASKDPSWPVNGSLFPDAPLWQGHAAPVVVDSVPANQRPITSARYLGGALKSVEFTLTGGEFSFALSLYPRIPRPAANNVALDWSDLAADMPTVTWAQLDTASWVEYRLTHATSIT